MVPWDFDQRFNEQMMWVTVKNRVPKGKEELVRKKIRSGANLVVVINYCTELGEQTNET